MSTPKIFITGDRSMDPVLAVDTLAPVLGILPQKFPGVTARNLITGDLPGVERAARYLVPSIRTFSYAQDADGHYLFDDAYDDLQDDVAYAIVLHTEPLTSRVTKALLRHFPEDRVWLPLTESVTFDL